MIDYSGVIEAIREKLESEMQIPVLVAPLPPSGGLCLNIASGNAKRDLSGNTYAKLRVNVNAKAEEQLASIERISAAHDILKDLSGETDDWQITGVSIITTPANLIDMAGNYITVSSVEVRAAFWEET